MSPQIAAIVFVIGILGLFALDRDRKARTSKALWIPVAWLSIVGSRAISNWLQIGPAVESPDQYLDGSPIDRLVFTGLLAVALIVLVARERRVLAILRANGPLLVYFFYCALSVLWSDFPGVAFKRWIKALGDLVMVLVVLTDPDRSAAARRLVARVGFLLMPLSILLIRYYGDLGRAYDKSDGSVQYTGVTTGKNLLGSICLIWGVGAVWRFVQAFRSRERSGRAGPLVAYGALLAMVLWLFWIANAMTSLSCFLMASVLLLTTSFRAPSRRLSVVHLLVATVVSVSFAVLFLDAGGGFLQTMG